MTSIKLANNLFFSVVYSLCIGFRYFFEGSIQSLFTFNSLSKLHKNEDIISLKKESSIFFK